MDKFTKAYLNLISQQRDQDFQYDMDDQERYGSRYEWHRSGGAEYKTTDFSTFPKLSYTFDAQNLSDFDNKKIKFEYQDEDIQVTIQGQEYYRAATWQEPEQSDVTFDYDSLDFEINLSQDCVFLTSEEIISDEEKEKYIKIFLGKYALTEKQLSVEVEGGDISDDYIYGTSFYSKIDEKDPLFELKDRYSI